MTEPSLREFQQWMKLRIRPPAPATANGGPRGAVAPPADILLNPQRGTPAEQRMSVYAGGYLTHMRDALAEVFEAAHQVLGEGVFIELAEAYAVRHPSHGYNLSLAGQHLPEFLRQWPRTEALPFLPDVAQLEWLICQAFHAFDQSPVDPQRIAAIPPEAWEHLRLSFQPSVGLVASSWPILDIWQARKQPREEIHIDLVDRPQRVLVYRHDVQVMCELLDTAQHTVLRGLQEGRTLGAVCEALAAQSSDTPPVTEWFTRWMSLGLITCCDIVH